jgi:hypothetical protein
LDSDAVREYAFQKARLRVRDMVLAGMTADEIATSFEGELNETERDLVWLLARHQHDHGVNSILERPGLLVPPPG